MHFLSTNTFSLSESGLKKVLSQNNVSDKIHLNFRQPIKTYFDLRSRLFHWSSVIENKRPMAYTRRIFFKLCNSIQAKNKLRYRFEIYNINRFKYVVFDKYVLIIIMTI
jgi:hypothetical protein